jgi:hypothetical protein
MAKSVLVSWDHPPNPNGGIPDGIEKYVLRTDFGASYDTVEVDAIQNTFLFENIEPGIYNVEIMSVNNAGQKSSTYSESIEIPPEPAKSEVTTTIGNIPIGGTINCPTFFRGTGNQFVFFIQQHDWTFKSPVADSTAVTNLSGIEDTYKQSLSNLPITPNLQYNPIAGGIMPDAYYILLSQNDAFDKVRLIRLEDGYDEPFWYDAGTGEKSAIKGTSNSSYGVALTGTITVKGSRVEGQGTDFIGEVLEGDVLFGTSSTEGDYLGVVQTIYSDELLKLDNTAGLPGEDHTFGRVNLRTDKLQDSIIARVFRTSASVFEHEIYTTLDNTLTASLLPTSESSNLIAHFTFDTMMNNKIAAVNRKVSNFVAEIVEPTNTTATITDESPVGNALLLDGTQYLRVLRDNFAYRHTNNAGGDFSLWFRSDTTSGQNNALIIGRKDLWSLTLDQSSSGDQTIALLDNTTGSTLMSALVSQGVWHQVALSTDNYTEAGKYKAYLYVDRVPLMSLEETSALLPNDASEPEGTLISKPLTVGGWASGSNAFVGAFTDLWIANSSFSDSQIASFWSRQGTEASSTGRPLNMGEGVNSIQVNENGIIVGGTDTSDSPFSVTTEGAVDATSGEIAGWKLSASSIYSGTAPETDGYSTGGFTLRKTGSIHSKNFYIDNDGDAFFKGQVSASSGQIGGWQIHTQGIYSSLLSYATGADIPSSGFLGNPGIVIHNQGSIHARDFFINSDGSSSFAGDISGATGTFSGGAGEGTITGNELQDGSVNADEIGTEGIAGYNISPSGTIAVFSRDGGGSVIPSSYAALDGADSDYRIYAGSDNPRRAPFRVTKAGQVTADNLQLFDANNNIYFDSNTGGFTPSAISQFARDLSARVSTATDLFTGNKDSADDSTYQEVVLTASTEVVTNIAIPITKMASRASEEYFGNRSNPLVIDLDVATIGTTGTTNLTRPTNIKKPNGDDLDRVLKVGELVRFNLENTKAGMAMTSVSGALNALTGSAFASNHPISGPANISYLLFEISGTSTDFTFSISSEQTADISMDAEVSANNSAKPDTETDARADLPTSITYGLNRSTVSAEHVASLTQVVAPITVTRVTTGTPTASQFLAKTLSKDVVDVDTIHSTVAVVPGGAVNDEGFIKSADDTETLDPEDYFYHSTLTFSGGDSNFYPENRLFTITSNDNDFIPAAGEGAISQSAQNTTIHDLTIGGQAFTPHATTITPLEVSGSAGTVTIAGNLHVTGTQTTVSQQDLTISDKHITLADGATTVGDVDTAGIIVDRSSISGIATDSYIEWNETPDEWEISNQTATPNFRSINDGTSLNPAYKFGNRTSATSATGFWASNQVVDTETHDQINITTQTHSDGVVTSYFNTAGITSSYNVYTSSSGQFRNYEGTWHATTGTAGGDFKFTNTTSGNTDPIMYLSSQFKRVGIGRTDPEYQLDVQHDAKNIARFESTTSSAFVVIRAPAGVNKWSTLELSADNGNSIYFRGRNGNMAQLFTPSNTYGKLDFHSSQGLPALKITRDNYADGDKPLKKHANLQLHNPNSGAAGTDKRYNSIVFTDYLSSTNQECQRGYIMCGPVSGTAGYGMMEFGIQTTVVDPESGSDEGLQPMLHLKDNRVSINTTLNTQYPFEVRGDATSQSDQGNINLSGNNAVEKGFVSGIYFTNRYTNPDSFAVFSGHKTGSDVFFRWGNDSVTTMELDYNGRLSVGSNVPNRKGDFNIKGASWTNVDASFSAASAANEVKIVHSVTSIKAMKVLAHVYDYDVGQNFVTELLVLCHGSTPVATEYATVTSDENTKNVQFEVDYSGGFYRIKATNLTGGIKSIRMLVNYIVNV